MVKHVTPDQGPDEKNPVSSSELVTADKKPKTVLSKILGGMLSKSAEK